jgi:hypothetical protein
MIEYLMPIGGLIAGALIYFALYESVEEHLNIKINKNILFPIFIIIMLVFGVFITEYIQMNERAGMNSSGAQKVIVYPCFTESTGACNDLTNKMNNDNYTAYQAGKETSLNLFIGFSLIDTIMKNVFSFFCVGILFLWGGVTLYSLKRVKE